MQNQNDVWELHKKAVSAYMLNKCEETAKEAEKTYQDWLKVLNSEGISRLHPHWMYYRLWEIKERG